MNTNEAHQRQSSTEADIEAYTIGGARRLDSTVYLADYDENWPHLFQREADRIQCVLGNHCVSLQHVGSTSVPGLAAKPIIDVVMEVTDSADEMCYVAPLEVVGYELRIREPDWFEHRVLKGPDTDVNLHVFTIGCPEVARMVCFRDILRRDTNAWRLYEETKRESAAQHWKYIQNYADAKTDIIDRIISADK